MRFVWNKIEARAKVRQAENDRRFAKLESQNKAICKQLRHCQLREKVSAERAGIKESVIVLLIAEVKRVSGKTRNVALISAEKQLDKLKEHPLPEPNPEIDALLVQFDEVP